MEFCPYIRAMKRCCFLLAVLLQLFLPRLALFSAAGGDVPMELSRADSIPVVLCADNAYAPLMYITLQSILRNSNEGTYYDFYLFVPSNFSPEYCRMIRALCKRHPCQVHFVDMEEAMKNAKSRKLPPSTFHRLLAADLLPHLQKCIYLDVDIIVCHDLGELFAIDLGDCYVGAVRDIGLIFFSTEYLKKFEAVTSDAWINNGVLLMNLDAIRRDGMTEKWQKMSEHGIDGKRPFRFADQDVLNISCTGKIKFIDPKFNVFASTFIICAAREENRRRCEEAFGRQAMSNAIADPCIVHFAGKKPWERLGDAPYVSEWWLLCRESPFYEHFLRGMLLHSAYNYLFRFPALNYHIFRMMTHFSSGDRKCHFEEKAFEAAYERKRAKLK